MRDHVVSMLSIAVIMNLVDLHDGLAYKLSNCIPFKLSTLLEMKWAETHKICMVWFYSTSGTPDMHTWRSVFITPHNGVL